MSTSLYAPDFLTIFDRYRDTGGPLGPYVGTSDQQTAEAANRAIESILE